MNYCDYGHDTSEEVRRLPIGQGGNIFLCESCFEKEMRYRRLRKIKHSVKWDFPEWEDLKIVQEECA